MWFLEGAFIYFHGKHVHKSLCVAQCGEVHKKNKAVYGHVLTLRFATLVRKHVFLAHFGHLKGTTGTTQVLMSVLMFFQALYDTCMECFEFIDLCMVIGLALPARIITCYLHVCSVLDHHGKDNGIYIYIWYAGNTYSKNKAKDTFQACHPLVQNLPSKAKVVIRRKNSPIEAWLPSSHGARWTRSVLNVFLNVYISCNSDMNWRVGKYIYIMNMYPVYVSRTSYEYISYIIVLWIEGYISLSTFMFLWSNQNPGSDIPLWLFDGSIEGQGLCPSERVALLEQSGDPQGFSNRMKLMARGMFGICFFWGGNGGFLKSCYPTTMGFPTKNDHCGVFWGYRRLRKHPNIF